MIHKSEFSRFLLLSAAFLLASCSGNEFAGADGEDRVLLQPVDGGSLSLAHSRSIVNGTAATASTDRISQLRIYLANMDNTSYSGIAATGEVFTWQSGGRWASATPVYLSGQHKLYACSPYSLAVTHNSAGNHTVPVTIPGTQTFNGGNAWECSSIDYLYGSASSTTGTATQITAGRTNSTAVIYLQHALAQLVFSIENAAGRTPEPDYDYVKSIQLKASSGTPFATGNATMRINDGTLTFSGASASELTFTPSGSTAVKVGETGKPSVVAYGLVAPRAVYTGTMKLTLTIGKVGETSTERELVVDATDVFNAEWERGRKYMYSLSLGDRGITINGAAVKGWTEVTGTGTGMPERD